jgi:hypothetical protein
LPDIDGIDLRNAALEEAISESAGRSAKIDRALIGHIELKMVERVLQLEPAAADEFLRRIQREFVILTNRIAWFAGNLIVDANLTGEDGAFGPFPAFTKPTVNQCLVQAEHE